MYLLNYNGEHSITFGTKNSWTDYHMIPTSRPIISPPKPKRITVDIPGTNGYLDLTTALTGGVIPLNRRTGQWNFVIDPDYNFHTIYGTVLTDLLTMAVTDFPIILSDQPDLTYYGVLFVENAQCDSRNNVLVISYDIQPYPIKSITGQWEWDPFNFDTNYIEQDGTVGSINVF